MIRTGDFRPGIFGALKTQTDLQFRLAAAGGVGRLGVN
jgi:hypothetical protein